jgi:hypothetical protein
MMTKLPDIVQRMKTTPGKVKAEKLYEQVNVFCVQLQTELKL